MESELWLAPTMAVIDIAWLMSRDYSGFRIFFYASFLLFLPTFFFKMAYAERSWTNQNFLWVKTLTTVHDYGKDWSIQSIVLWSKQQIIRGCSWLHHKIHAKCILTYCFIKVPHREQVWKWTGFWTTKCWAKIIQRDRNCRTEIRLTT